MFSILNTALLVAILAALGYFGKKIMATQAELAQQIRNVTLQNEKARAEIVARVQELQDALDNAGNTTPEVDEAMSNLRASVQADDDMNPDATTPTEPGEGQA